MSQQNVEWAHQAVDAFNRRDLGAWLDLMDTDVEFAAGGVAMEGDYHGHAEIRRFWNNLLDALPDLAVEVVEMRDLGDLVFGAVHIRGHGGGSDTPFDETFWGIAEWRDGKCVWWCNGSTEAEVLEAAGLGE
jgi:ketosteroid isomerase-like protein